MIFEGNKQELDAYIRHMADLCGLRDWTIRVDIEHDVDVDNHRFAHGSAAAASTVSHNRQYVVLTFASDWPTWDADTLRQTVVHELTHCHTGRMLYAFHNVQTILGSGALFELADAQFDDAHEIAVDAIATAWAAFLPLPVKETDETAAEAADDAQEAA